MTSFEHAMLAINGVFATGLQRRYTWRIVAVAGVAGIAPDWDGITILGGLQLFDHAHRVWGHSLLTCLLLAVVIGGLDYRFDGVGHGERLLGWLLRTPSGLANTSERESSWHRWTTWMVVAVGATMSHLLADLVFSGTAELADWHLQLFWPFSSAGFIYPLVHWGDAGVTIIFVVSMFAMVRLRSRIQLLAVITLLAVVVYIGIRGTALP